MWHVVSRELGQYTPGEWLFRVGIADRRKDTRASAGHFSNTRTPFTKWIAPFGIGSLFDHCERLCGVTHGEIPCNGQTARETSGRWDRLAGC